MEFKLYTLKILLSCCITWCYGQDHIRMTVLSYNHFRSEIDSHYQCRMSPPVTEETQYTVESLRTGWTRNEEDENPDPPQAEYISESRPYHRVALLNNGNNDAFGVFGCNARKDGWKDTVISTTKMRSDADIVPSNDLFTQTVSIGDTDVSISMRITYNAFQTDQLRWRNNTNFWSNTHPSFGADTFWFDEPIELYHAGIYECHRQGNRYLAKHGLNLLIVRACPHTRWGPPDCEGVCDSCYNGAVCDENTGKCVCAPGFTGENCLTACGGNRYGYDCEQRCTYSSDDPKFKCGATLFCLVHPFGCRCNTGFGGLDCNTGCGVNKFGANCLQTCHCTSNQCNRYTGECEGAVINCKPGWTGANCQECTDGYFGSSCDQKCHCSSDKCNRESGLCQPGGCLPQWVDLFPPYSCQTGLESATYTKVNPSVPVPVNCTSVGLQEPTGDFTDLHVVLSRSSDDLDDNDITLNETFILDTRETSLFMVGGVDQNVTLYCQLLDQSDRRVAFLTVEVFLYELPKLKNAPSEVSTSNTSVTITWTAWDVTKDEGDPPVVGYVTYYRNDTDDDWIKGGDETAKGSLEYTFINLDADTDYSFSVAAVREGEGGEGPKGSSLAVKTICAVPSDGPKNVATNVAGDEQQLVEIFWEHPSTDDIRCRGGIVMFKIYYSPSLSPNAETFVEVGDPSATSFIIEGLEVGKAYVFEMTLTTEGGESRKSSPVEHLLPVLPQLSKSPEFVESTSTSLTVRWQAWNESSDTGTPPVVSYNLYHKLSDELEWDSAISCDAVDGQEEYYGTVADLIADSLYDFRVTAVRIGFGGEGRESPALTEQKTVCDGGNIGATIGISVAISLFTVLGVIVIIFCMKRHSKSEAKDEKDYHDVAVNKAYSDDRGSLPFYSKSLQEIEEDAIYDEIKISEVILLKDFEQYIKSSALEQQFAKFESYPESSHEVGSKEENKKKNRFQNMIAYDHSRVVLQEKSNDRHSDYYNANYIKNSKGEAGFIAAQGPNKASVDDFWRMVCMENVSTIVMLTNLIENGKDRCFRYWPPSVGETTVFGEIKVKWQSSEQYAYFEIREYLVSLKDKTHRVRNWHFKTWTNKDIPNQPSTLIEFARRVKKGHASSAPLLVHCSTGVGRTGTFIALCSLMDVVQTSDMIDVFGFVAQMRADRVSMVQTAEQFKFLHGCLLEVYLTGDASIPVEKLPTFEVYSDSEKLEKEFKLLAKLDKLSKSDSSSATNTYEKHRFPEIIPEEDKRLSLHSPSKYSSSNYINACSVMSYRKESSFIATQSPLPSTIEDFWTLVFDWKCPLIVMLNQLDDNDETIFKYWPDAESSHYGNMTVELKEERKENHNYTHRLFQVDHVNNQTPISVSHLQLNSWDENNPWEIFSFIKEIEKLQQDMTMVEPTLIHCINGVGRTGVVIAVKSEMERIEAEKKVDVFTTVRQMRASNHSLVQTKEEYALCYHLLKLSSQKSTYTNI